MNGKIAFTEKRNKMAFDYRIASFLNIIPLPVLYYSDNLLLFR